MIDQPADSEVTPRNILAPHRARTLQRMQNQTEVLCVQDGTDLNFADHGKCKGLGLISKNKASAGTVGIHMHSMLALDSQGVPLTPCRTSSMASIEDEKMLRWSRGLQQCSAMAAELEGVRLVSVMDREGDCFELFVERRRLGNVELLVRARYNRSLGKGVAKLFDVIRRQSEHVGSRCLSDIVRRVAAVAVRKRSQNRLRGLPRCRCAGGKCSCRCRAAVSSKTSHRCQ